MGWQLSYHLLPMVVGVVIGITLVPIVWRYREERGAKWLLLMILSVIAWGAVYSLQVASTDLAAKELFNNFRYPFVAATTTTWLLFALAYTNNEQWITRKTVGLLVAIPVASVVVVWTNDYHLLMRGETSVVTQSGIAILDIQYGPWFWVHAVHAYAGVLAGSILVGRSALDTWGMYRGQALALVIGVILPVGASVVHNAGFTTVDYTPALFTVTMSLFAFALIRYELLDMMPVARETVIEEMHDGVLVLDTEGRVVDMNQSATDLLDIPQGAIGDHVDEAFPIPLTERYSGLEDTEDEIQLDNGSQASHFTLRITGIQDERGDPTGWIVVFRNVSEIKRREQELNLLRQVLNRILRHNMRNELTAIRGSAETIPQADDETLEYLVDTILESSNDLLQTGEKARHIGQVIHDLKEEVELDAADVVRKVAESAREEYDGATIETDLPGETPVSVHEGLPTAVDNLVENAVLHNDAENPWVRISVERTDDTVEVAITDDGPGIPDHEIDVLRRQHETALEHGSGAGLWLVNWVVRKSGGELEFDREDGWTTVSVSLPAVRTADEMIPDREAASG